MFLMENFKFRYQSQNKTKSFLLKISQHISTCLFVLQYAFRAATKVNLVGLEVLFIHTSRSSRVLARWGDPTPLSCASMSRAFQWWHSRCRYLDGKPCTYGLCGSRPSENLVDLTAQAQSEPRNRAEHQEIGPPCPVKGWQSLT